MVSPQNLRIFALTADIYFPFVVKTQMKKFEHLVAYGGGWMICHFSIIYVNFVFLLIEFHCTFPYLMKYYNIMFIIIVC